MTEQALPPLRVDQAGTIDRIGTLVLAMGLVVVTGCATSDVYQVHLMPAPAIFGEARFNPFQSEALVQAPPREGVLYATDRDLLAQPPPGRLYGNERGHLLRLGSARVDVARPGLNWQDLQQPSVFSHRGLRFPLQITDVEEYGILPASVTSWHDPRTLPPDLAVGARRFVEAVDHRLAASEGDDVYVYVHGYRVPFANPVLVAAELWHFLGYEGVFVAYSWPARPRLTAYFADAETATYAARNFRLFLDFLGTETKAKQVHVIAYSAGTRMVIRALEQIALQYGDEPPEARPRIGQVLVVGGDLDSALFASALADGLLNVVGSLTVYQSRADKALSFARRMLSQQRVGQLSADRPFPDYVDRQIRRQEELHVVNVTDAERATSGNGHSYFRNSPWASSDILMTLRYDLRPGERGLVRRPDAAAWEFPPDYIARLSQVVYARRPEWAPHPQHISPFQPVPLR